MSLFERSIAFKPFKYEWAHDLAKVHESIHWVEDEVNLGDDVRDWTTTMTQGERDFITRILRLFTQSDVEVGKVYYDYLIPSVSNNEVRVMLGSFAAREGTHQRAYALLNETLGLPETEWTEFLSWKEMRDKVEFMQKHSGNSVEDKALAFAKVAATEGISLFAMFVMLLDYQRRGKMRGTNTIVEWSLRDETVHFNGNSAVFRAICEENPYIVTPEFKSKLYAMIEELVGLEDCFIDLAYGKFPEASQGTTAEDTKKYVRYIADRRLVLLGLKPIYNEDNPYPWLDHIINAATHDNFFEKRVTEYAAGGMSGEWIYDET